MQLSEPHYLPLTPAFFSVLAVILLVLTVLIMVGLIRFASMRLGLSAGAVLLLLLASLIGSYFNIPLAQFPEQRVASGEEVDFFGMGYVVPAVVQWPGTVIAVNVGGAVIPALMSAYLLVKNRLWLQALVATAGVALV